MAVDQPPAAAPTRTDDKIMEILRMLAEGQQSTRNNDAYFNRHPTAQGIRIPEVNLPTFNGDLKDYKSFKTTFESVINHSRTTTIERFALLRSKLLGPALESIAPLSVIEENYAAAWDILDRQFDNNRVTMEANLQFLLTGAHASPKYSHLLKYKTSYLAMWNNLTDTTLENVVLFFLMKMLDSYTASRLEDALGTTCDMPTKRFFDDFIEKECAIAARRQEKSKPQEKPKEGKKAPFTTSAHASTNYDDYKRKVKCFICSNEHFTKECKTFLESTDREALLRDHKICIFCVKHRFDFRRPCKARDHLKCDLCSDKHITEMHKRNVTQAFLNNQLNASHVMLPTAIAKIIATEGMTVEARCLIDLCSQNSYICEDLVQKLKLQRFKTYALTSGVGGVISKCKSFVKLQIKIDDPEHPVLTCSALVVKKILVNNLPALPADINLETSEYPLADTKLKKPAYTPLLLGADVAPEIFMDGVKYMNGFLLQQTKLGWIVSGGRKNEIARFTSAHVNITEMENRLIEFWDMPISKEEKNEADDEFCDQLFKLKLSRDAEGRYIVPTMWKPNAPELGDSYHRALKCYLSLEKRLERDAKHKEMSDTFMQEYLDLGHMVEIPNDQQQNTSGDVYYIPYLSVIRKNAVTTKLRNVFNASTASSNGISLNQQIFAGPKLQTHIFDLIVRTRQFPIIYSADVTKMFRQILVREEDRDKQRIIWRKNTTDPLKEYRLQTVTYGKIDSPYLSIKTFHQIADDHAPDNDTKMIIKNGFYVDDLLHGGDTVEECQQQIAKIVACMEKGKMPLTKWTSNVPATLQDIDPSNQLNSYVDLSKADASTKTLGLVFHPQEDAYAPMTPELGPVTYTKRGLLSMSASIYDPIGWLLPLVMMLRIFLQTLWVNKYDWDDEIEPQLKQKFENCFTHMRSLNKIRIPRWTGGFKATKLELIGFADASKLGYAAVIYSRVKIGEIFQTRLIAAKGRVTPLKTRLVDEQKLNTIPKLELEALVLLIELYEIILKCYAGLSTTFTAYTDSEVSLAWIRREKEIENKFVKRRVTKIRKVIKPTDIHHVKSADNPADHGSRGLTPEKLAACSQWFEGPDWLKNETLPTTPYRPETISISNVTMTENVDNFVITRFSDWNRLIKVTATCLRWLNKLEKIVHPFKTGPITAEEVSAARNKILKYQQGIDFTRELELLRAGKQIPTKNPLSALYPFVDETDQLLRVGGRISQAKINESQKHPILLKKGHLVDMIIRKTHLEQGHAGNALTERTIRETYWITAVRSRIKKCIRACPICIRWKARTIAPLMAELPAARVSPAPVFAHTGVDLCGPFNVKASAIKFDRMIKIWIASFVCLISKNIHLEICTDLSTDAFLAAFTRFTSRRSCPTNMYSDNGSNFVGSNRKIQDAWKKMLKEAENLHAIQEIKWHFIPAFSPHQGGLWEGSVKSLKYFMRRMADPINLTQHEFGTLICKIEGLLNSRPLYPDTSDPSEDAVLTPFHFTTQRSLKQPPTDYIVPAKSPVTKKWLQIQQIQRDFWHRFEAEYLGHLLKRYKWKYPTRPVQVDDLVLLQEPNTTPGEWKRGKVTKVYPDPKGQVRKVDVQTASKTYDQRATNRLVPLMPEDEQPEETVRRSKRLATPSVALVTKALLCWMAFTTPANGLLIQSLTPGIHIQKLDNAYVRAFDLKFTIKTSLNFNYSTTN